MSVSVTRYQDISCGHRVYGHEGGCKNLHGHNYRVHFTVISKGAQIDSIGRVVDFSVIKEQLCQYILDRWDHRTLLWYQDPLYHKLRDISPNSIVGVPFNPTAENIAHELVENVGPLIFDGTLFELVSVKIDETTKCSATYTKEKSNV